MKASRAAVAVLPPSAGLSPWRPASYVSSPSGARADRAADANDRHRQPLSWHPSHQELYGTLPLTTFLAGVDCRVARDGVGRLRRGQHELQKVQGAAPLCASATGRDRCVVAHLGSRSRWPRARTSNSASDSIWHDVFTWHRKEQVNGQLPAAGPRPHSFRNKLASIFSPTLINALKEKTSGKTPSVYICLKISQPS